jgi:hypothetical protein
LCFSTTKGANLTKFSPFLAIKNEPFGGWLLLTGELTSKTKATFMNGIKSIFLTSLCVIGVLTAASGEEFRTDINPALRYYQAFIMGGELSQDDRDYLYTNEWRGQKLPGRFGDLVSSYNSRFTAMREAGQATVPCDWGIDMSAGPATLLPHLPRCKSLAVAVKLRVLWELQNGKETDARDNLVAAYALGRNSSKDGTLIAALVEIAIENIVINTVAENFHSFSAETLQQLAGGFDSAPSEGTTAAALLSGEKAIHDWLERKILQWQKENPGDDSQVMAKLRELFRSMADESGRTNQWEAVIRIAGTSEDVLKLVRDEDVFRQKAAEIMGLPHPAFEEQSKQFQAEVDKSGNPLLALSFPTILKARSKEFRAQAKLAMFHAAVAYKLRGEEGLRSVNDPLGQGPFQFERFVFEGVDRGFKLTSAYAGNGYPETLIFVESEGTPFICDGPKAGQPLSK